MDNNMTINKKWYIIQCPAGKEYAVSRRLISIFSNAAYTDYVSAVLVPSEEINSLNKGRVKFIKRPIISGYVYIKAILKNNIKTVIEDGIIIGEHKVWLKFLGKNTYSSRIQPLSESDAAYAESHLTGTINSKDFYSNLLVGDTVNFLSNNFAEFSGKILAIQNNETTVEIPVFNRRLSVKVSLSDLRKT